MKKIALFGRFDYNFPEEHTVLVLEELEKYGAEVVVEKRSLQKVTAITNTQYETFSCHEDLDDSYDLFVSIGGDGTILRALKIIRDTGIPILGINAGRMGFLANVQKEDIAATFKNIFEDNYTISKRNLLTLENHEDIEGLDDDYNFALNEITVSRKNTTSMITVNTHVDGEYLTSYWADGLIVSTATGSTGYSLSCGGPIIAPQANSFVLTPIAPHNLNMRPLIIPETTDVKLSVNGREEMHLVALDGRIVTVKNGTELKIRKANFQVNMLIPHNSSFIKTIRKKMLWGEDIRN